MAKGQHEINMGINILNANSQPGVCECVSKFGVRSARSLIRAVCVTYAGKSLLQSQTHTDVRSRTVRPHGS